MYSQNLYFEACFELISVELRLNLVELRLSHVFFYSTPFSYIKAKHISLNQNNTVDYSRQRTTYTDKDQKNNAKFNPNPVVTNFGQISTYPDRFLII